MKAAADCAVDVEQGLALQIKALKIFVGPDALQFRARAPGEHFHQRQNQRVFLHRFVINDHQMADDLLRGIAQRHAQVTLRVHLRQRLVLGKQTLQVAVVVTRATLGHFQARRPVQVIFKLRPGFVSNPKGE